MENESGLFKLKVKDWLNGIITAVCVGILPILNNAVQSGDLSQIDWANAGKIALYAGLGYIIRKLLSTPDGKIFGKIGPQKQV